MSNYNATEEELSFFLSEDSQSRYLSHHSGKGTTLNLKVTDNAPAGIINEGSTCYMNSVLQSLLQVPNFIKMLFNMSEEKSSIISQLRILFARLQFSVISCQRTRELTQSFGWNSSQSRQQHDSHEFFGILMDALIETIDENSKNQLKSIFQGKQTDIMRCPNCNNEHSNMSDFLCLSIDVPEVEASSSNPHNLMNLIQNYIKEEQLDEDNKWQCSSCGEKVCAFRKQAIKSLPPTLVIHLKRFSFDKVSMSRSKITSHVAFPESCNFNDLLSSSDEYELTGIILHFGTAMGGHYKSIVRSALNSDVWWDCNDSNVQQLSSAEVAALLGKTNETHLMSRNSRSIALENAYMLVYQRKGSLGNNFNDLPKDLSEIINSENEAAKVLYTLETIRKKLVQCEIIINSSNSSIFGKRVSNYFPLHYTMSEVRAKIYAQCIKEGLIDESKIALEQCRIRRVPRVRSGAEETFGDRQDSTLLDLKFDDSERFYLDIRTTDEPEFEEFHPDDVSVSIHVWENKETFADLLKEEQSYFGQHTERSWLLLPVPGRQSATVGALRKAVSSHIANIGDAPIFLTFQSTVTPQVMGSDDQTIKECFNASSDFHVIILRQAELQESAIGELELLRSQLTVYFNNPNSAEEVKYDLSVNITCTSTLKELKELIRAQLSLESIDGFHLRRGAAAPQYKDEAKSLQDLSIANYSIVHVQWGKGCQTGEHMLRFEIPVRVEAPPAEPETAEGDGAEEGIAASQKPAPISTTRYILLGELAISEKWSILQLKKHLHSSWASIVSEMEAKGENVASLQNPKTENCIRLRDLKGGKLSSALRNDRIVGRCLLGIADGRRLAVQILEEEEIINTDDLLIGVRVASYDKRTLGEAVDVCIPRTFTPPMLYDKLLAIFADIAEPIPSDAEGVETPLQRLDIAKAFTSGPPLSLKSALKLKWNDCPYVLAEGAEVPEGANSPVDRPPLNLRDGSIIVIRGKADWLRAQARVKAKRDALGADGGEAAAAGAGLAAARANKGRRLASSQGSRQRAAALKASATEPSLKIAANKELPVAPSQDGDKPPLSPGKENEN